MKRMGASQFVFIRSFSCKIPKTIRFIRVIRSFIIASYSFSSPEQYKCSSDNHQSTAHNVA